MEQINTLLKDKIVVLYSPQQKCFHIESYQVYIKHNTKKALLQIEFTQFQLLGIFNDLKLASEFIDFFKKEQLKIKK